MDTMVLSEDVFDTDDDDYIAESYYCDYDDTEYFFGDIDNQDGRYCDRVRYTEASCFDDYSFDDYSLETKKRKAVLYLHLHQELMRDTRYKEAYDILRDEALRTCVYWMEHSAIIGPISEEDRAPENFALDMQLLEYGKAKVNTYKYDAVYIVNGISTGVLC